MTTAVEAPAPAAASAIEKPQPVPVGWEPNVIAFACHYCAFAARRILYVKKLLTTLGIDPDRLEMFNLSAAMGPRWAEICTQFVEKVRGRGPSPINAAKLKQQC